MTVKESCLRNCSVEDLKKYRKFLYFLPHLHKELNCGFEGNPAIQISAINKKKEISKIYLFYKDITREMSRRLKERDGTKLQLVRIKRLLRYAF